MSAFGRRVVCRVIMGASCEYCILGVACTTRKETVGYELVSSEKFYRRLFSSIVNYVISMYLGMLNGGSFRTVISSSLLLQE
jgi:hypothetical protein